MVFIKKLISLAAASLITFTAASFPTFAEELPSGISYDDIGSKIEEYYETKKKGDGGVAVAVFDSENMIYSGYFGYADKENDIRFSKDTASEWGSITKLMVWVSAMQLYEQGKLDLNADIRTYLPDGFFKRLKYDDEITFLNLMNHDAGFEDVYLGLQTLDESNHRSLEDALKMSEPAQIFRPGEVVSYSNWGAALAGYIVERISGERFCDYAQENIISPLGMEHTALDFDLSDDPAVKEKRREMKSYLPDGTPNPEERAFIYLYPAGMCTSPLSDITTFGQALLSCDERLMSKETFEEMYEPTTVYENGIAANYHGFWLMKMTDVPIIGHNGGTNCCSSTLIFNREQNIGIAILTNQPGESIFNLGLPSLVFGDYDGDEPLSDISENGIYMCPRNPFTGPFKLLYALGPTIVNDEIRNSPSNFGEPYFQHGDKLRAPSIDFIKMSTGDLIAQYLPIALWLIAFAVCVVFIIIKLVMLVLRKKSINPMKTWHNIMAILVPATVILMTINLLLISLYSRAVSTTISVIAFITMLALAAFVIYGIVSLPKMTGAAEKAKGRMVFRNICMIFFGAVSVYNMIFWELCFFWRV